MTIERVQVWCEDADILNVILLVSVGATLALVGVVTIVASTVGARTARRYRRKDALDIVHSWRINRSGRR